MITLNRLQAAAFLNMHPVTLLQKVHAGIIPAAKPAKSWVFIQQDLLDYLRGLYSTNKHNEQNIDNQSEVASRCHVTVTKKGLGVKSGYYQLLGIADCPQIHSPQPDPRSGACHADGVGQVAHSEAVGLVVNSVNMTQSKTRMM
ncbi:MAG: helix-turn-helix domain-containing protein [Methylotenera sp.]|nr:helix-turn-helix domain-containing protein [Methylotenera sp.]